MSEEPTLLEEQALAKPRGHSPFEEGSDGPTTRGTIDRNVVAKRPQRRYMNGAKVHMRRSSSEHFEFQMIVTGCEYDEERAGWNYTLKEDNAQQLAWPKKVKETNLKKRK